MLAPTHGGIYAWEFEKDERELKVRVEGQIISNTIYQVLDAVLAGIGLGHMPEEMALPHIAEGRLMRVLEDWSPPWPGTVSIIPAGGMRLLNEDLSPRCLSG